MENKGSSRKRPSKKAVTPVPSTSSSTTGPPASPADVRELTSDDPGPSTITDLFDPLTRRQQREFEKLLSNGASPAAACNKLGLPHDALWVTIDRDDRFVTRCRRICESLHENVKAAIYKAAMQGKLGAQSNWLRLMQAEAELEERTARQQAEAGDSDQAARLRARRLAALFRSWEQSAKTESDSPDPESK